MRTSSRRSAGPWTPRTSGPLGALGRPTSTRAGGPIFPEAQLPLFATPPPEAPNLAQENPVPATALCPGGWG